MEQVCRALLIAPFNRAQPWLFKGKGLMKFGFFKGRSPLLCAPLCNDYRQVSRILALNRTGGLKRKWNWKTWVLCQNDEMMPKQLVYKAGVRTWEVGRRCQMSWSQPFRKMAGASGSAPQRPSICAPLCLDARTHALCMHAVQVCQKWWKSFISTRLLETLQAIFGLINITFSCQL